MNHEYLTCLIVYLTDSQVVVAAVKSFKRGRCKIVCHENHNVIMMETPVSTFTDHNVITIETLVYISIMTFIAILGAAILNVALNEVVTCPK